MNVTRPKKKFFIIGCPRSGTTMVQQALNRHPAIAIPPETKFFFSFIGHPRRHQARHLERLNRDLGIQLTLPPQGTTSDAAAREMYEAMEDQYIRQLGKPGIEWFGEKTPEHTGRASRIRGLFPDSRILVLYRDGRDVALSLSKAPWMSGGLYVSFLIWLYYQQLILKLRHGGMSNVLLARYEDIVTSPEREFRRILAFLDLTYDPRVAEGYGNSDGIPLREYEWKAHALERINASRVGAYRSELTMTQIAALERLGRHTLEAFGYPVEAAGSSLLPLRILFRLPRQMAKFAAQLPWWSLVSEMAEQFRGA